MIKRTLRVLSGITAVSVFFSAVGASSAEDSQKVLPNTVSAQPSQNGASSKNGGLYKEETVYVISDANGNAEKTIVSDWLKNAGESSEIGDISFLSDIKNVKGDEEFNSDGENLTWQSNGNDIYYQGTTDKETPVSVRLTYYLDGREVSPEEIKGKSGRVKIRIDYQNNLKRKAVINGNEQELTVPFVMLTGMIFDNDIFTNITVSNGKLISDGDRSIAIGYAMPGMSDTLGLSDADGIDLDIPETVEIEADAEDFALTSTITAASNSIFEEIGDIDENSTLDELADSLEDLNDASSRLADGSSELYDGLTTLLESSKTLAGGVKKLYDGSNMLKGGIKTLKKGSSDIAGGAKQLNSGAADLKSGSKTLKIGAADLNSGAKTLSNGTVSAKNGALELKKGAASLYSGLGDAATGSLQLYEGLNDLNTNKSELINGLKSLSGGLTDVSDGIDFAKKNLDDTIAANEKVLEGLKKVYEQLPSDDIKTMIETLEKTIYGQKQISESMTPGGEGLKDGVTKLLSGTGALEAGADKLSQGVQSLYDGSEKLNTGIASLYGGSLKLRDGSSSLYDALVKIDTGAGSLYEGSQKLATGADSLFKGSKTLKTGTASLFKGAKSLNGGAVRLSTGSVELANGLGALYKNSKAFADGVKKLKTGSEELNDGLIKFDRDGIKKLYNAFNGNISEFVERLNAVRNISKGYNNFSGIAENAGGAVKFIFKTDEI